MLLLNWLVLLKRLLRLNLQPLLLLRLSLFPLLLLDQLMLLMLLVVVDLLMLLSLFPSLLLMDMELGEARTRNSATSESASI